MFTGVFRIAHRPQAELAGGVALDVADPFRGDERDDADDGVANGEDRPEDPYGLRVAHVAGGVDLGRVHIFDFRAHFRLSEDTIMNT